MVNKMNKMNLKREKRVYWDGISGKVGVCDFHYKDRSPQIVTCSRYFPKLGVWDIKLDKKFPEMITVMPEHLFSLNEKKVNVYAFDSDGNISSYHFYGTPDEEKIERENILEGNKVAYVIKKEDFVIRYVPKEYDLDGLSDFREYNYKKVKVWIVEDTLKNTLSQVKAEILKHKPKSRIHYSGEPCNLSVCEIYKEKATGFKFEYTGEYRSLKSGDWFVSNNETEIIKAIYDYHNFYRWILKAIPVDNKDLVLTNSITLSKEEIGYAKQSSEIITEITKKCLYELLLECDKKNYRIEDLEFSIRAKIKSN